MVALAASTALLFFNGTIRTNTRSLDAVASSICFDSVVKATGTLDAVAATRVRILCAEDLAKRARDAAHLPVVMHLIGDLVRSYE